MGRHFFRFGYDWGSIFWLGLMMATPAISAPAKQIILRDHTRISGRSVSAIDQDSIQLDNGVELTWDQVLRATVANEQQARFDQFVREIGLPLARIKFRLASGDWNGGCRLASSLSDRWRSQLNPNASQLEVDQRYLVSRLAADQHLRSGERGLAVLNLVAALGWQRRISDDVQALVGEQVYPPQVVASGFDRQLLPIWFDDREVRLVRPQLLSWAESMSESSPGIWLYLASMEIHLGQAELADQHLLRLRELVAAESTPDKHLQLAIEILDWSQTRSPETAVELESRSFALDRRLWAWLQFLRYGRDDRQGTAKENETQRWDRVLQLINVVANEGQAAPEIASAALYTASQIARDLGDSPTADKLIQQLRQDFPQTYHARAMAGVSESIQRSQR